MGDDDLNAAPASRSGGTPDIGSQLDALWQLASVARAWGGEPGTVLTERAERVARLHGFDLGTTTTTQAASVVAEISLAMCQAFPGLQCTGLHINPRPLKLAAENIAAENQQDRVELRRQSF